MKKISFNKTDLLIGLIVSILLILFSFYSFPFLESLERVVLGIQMRLDVPQNLGMNKIAIVNIDEKSVKQIGPWPWPRHVIGEMIHVLKNNGAKFIGVELMFSEKEYNGGLTEIRELQRSILEHGGPHLKDPWLIKQLKEIEIRLDNDSFLSSAVKASGNVYFPVQGIYGKYETDMVLPEDSIISKNCLKTKGIFENIQPVNQLKSPFPELAEVSGGMGHTNLPLQKTLQGLVHLLFIDYRGNIVPSLAFRLALDYLKKSPEEAIEPGKGIRLTKNLIPTSNGEIFIKYRGAKRSFPYYSFVDILNVKKVPAVFEGKIVLIGITAEATTAVNTPVDPALPNIELTANIIDNLIHGRALNRPVSMKYIEAVILLLLTLLCAFLLSRFSFINRLGVVAGLIVFAFILSLISFMVFEIHFKMTYITLALCILFLEHFIRDIILTQRTIGITSKESIETNRMLGLSLQSQGLLDLAFEKFRKCPFDDAMKDVIYNLGLDYERKRMMNKAVAVYEYIIQNDKNYRDLNGRVLKLKKLINPLDSVGQEIKQDGKIIVSEDLGIKPTVGRYEILNEIGQGAMGIVYKARDPKINRMVAIKTIRFSDEFEEKKIKEVKERFLREAEIAGKLSHPTIVSIYDVGEDYDLTYIAMEFLEGNDLHKYCRKGSLLPIRKVLEVIEESAFALDYAHKHGVIHRDIKPANIMLLHDGTVKVTDFGIAKAVSSSQTKSGIVLGTPNYMSPEQINGHEIDGRSDLFSLGVVFFELLTGQVPFSGKNLTSLFYQITQAKHPSPRSINPRIPILCEHIIDKALAKDPAKRFSASAEFGKYLKAMIIKLDQSRVSVKTPPPIH